MLEFSGLFHRYTGGMNVGAYLIQFQRASRGWFKKWPYVDVPISSRITPCSPPPCAFHTPGLVPPTPSSFHCSKVRTGTSALPRSAEPAAAASAGPDSAAEAADPAPPGWHQSDITVLVGTQSGWYLPYLNHDRPASSPNKRVKTLN